MAVSLAEVGRRGRMDLTFATQSGRTILCDAYCEVPFKITRVLNPGFSPAHLILMQCTAGLFGGDDVESSISVERGASVLITQQSANRVHPSGDRPAIQRNRVFVENGAELRLYLEPVIPFADSFLQQTTRIDIEAGARLVFWEGLMAGRVGRGERWQFRRFDSETQLRSNGRPLYLDRFLLPNGFETSACAMGDSNYSGTGLFVGEQAARVAAALHDALPEAGVDMLAAAVVIVRVVSCTGPEFHRSREIFRRLTELS